jgi:RHS repeat-associated protein
VPEKLIKPSGLAYGFEYDGEDRLVAFSLPGNEKVEWMYTNDLLVGIRMNGVTTSFEYDEAENVTAIVYPDTGKTKLYYNKAGMVVKITDKDDAVRTFETLVCNGKLMYREIDKLGRKIDYEMDTVGNVVAVVFPDNSKQEMIFGEASSVSGIVGRNNSVTSIQSHPLVRNVSFDDGRYISSYRNQQGLLEAVENENGTLLYSYNSKGQLVTEEFEEKIAAYEYDPDNLLTKIAYPSGLNVLYNYDEDARVSSIETNGKKSLFTYHTNEMIVHAAYPNGVEESWKYLLLSGVQEIRVQSQWKEVLSHQKYVYDDLFLLKKLYLQDAKTGSALLTISYDAGGRIVSRVNNTTGSTEDFRYDGKGNLVKAGSTERKTGSLDQVLEIGGNKMAYDDAGFLRVYYANNKRIELRFSAAGLLTSAMSDGEEWNYEYDGLGRRIRKYSSQEDYTYTWSKNRLMSEECLSGSKNTFRDYIYLPYSNACTGFIEDNKMYWVHKDARGAVCLVTDEMGDIVWAATYDVFGKAAITVDKIKQPWRLWGQYYDEETHLCYNGSRYYNADIPSYISPNTEWYSENAAHYSYSLNSPYNYACPDGHVNIPLVPGLQIIHRMRDFFCSRQQSYAVMSKSKLARHTISGFENGRFSLFDQSHFLAPALTDANDYILFNCLFK